MSASFFVWFPDRQSSRESFAQILSASNRRVCKKRTPVPIMQIFSGSQSDEKMHRSVHRCATTSEAA